jgi:EAL domain-containing protein (putative c-di-GMP-specific phosphodiesterase class I)
MQLERSEFRTTLLEILRKTAYPATGLCLQLNQGSRQLGTDHLRSQVEFLKSCGLKIGLDVADFAALDLTRHLTVDILNLSPAITGGINDNLTNKYMVETMTSYAHRLGIRTRVTGIEDEDTALTARQYPISEVMGYYYGRPCSINDFKAKYVTNS